MGYRAYPLSGGVSRSLGGIGKAWHSEEYECSVLTESNFSRKSDYFAHPYTGYSMAGFNPGSTSIACRSDIFLRTSAIW